MWVYPRPMETNPSETDSGETPDRADATETGNREADGEPQEHFGPLLLRRLRKQDGRSLILYESR